MRAQLRLVGLVAVVALAAFAVVAPFEVSPPMALSAVFGATIPVAFVYWTVLRESTG